MSCRYWTYLGKLVILRVTETIAITTDKVYGYGIYTYDNIFQIIMVIVILMVMANLNRGYWMLNLS